MTEKRLASDEIRNVELDIETQKTVDSLNFFETVKLYLQKSLKWKDIHLPRGPGQKPMFYFINQQIAPESY
jgi:hypothetical protein